MTERVVHKFGGTSLADASCFRRVADIIAARPESHRAVVVSAMSGVTNALIRAVELAGARDADGYSRVLAELREKHQRALAAITDVLHATTLLRRSSRETLDLVAGYGEIWSAQLLHALLVTNGTPCAWINARDVLVAEWDDANVQIDWTASRVRLDERFSASNLPATLIITGFVASTHDGVATTLGRNGSDF